MADDTLLDDPIQSISIVDEMKSSYLDYAMSVIVARALPDVRDGLKPVHRRILYSAAESGFVAGKPYRKSARIVGDVMGKYHPHGDSSIYEALVRMSQDWSMRVPLIDGQGNFGSMDPDPPAAMRYTEARLGKVANFLLADIDKDTVDFQPNYDASEREPQVLPARFPNLLVNGAGGIAVGMATNIPPHNLGEVIAACLAYMDNGAITTEELFEIVPGPDFPTGAIILGRAGAKSAYETGRGSIIVRSRHIVEEGKGDRRALFTELADKLAAHATIEEQLFYPAVMAKETNELLHESVEEHLTIKRVLADLIEMKLDEDSFMAKLSVLKENVSHHAHKEEEAKLFPKVRAALSADERAALGGELLAMFEKLMEGHPYKTVPAETAAAAELPPAPRA